MADNQAPDRDRNQYKCWFQSVKTVLICLHILTIIGLIILIIMSASNNSPHLTQQTSKSSSDELTVYAIGLLVIIVSVVGVIKGNVCILTTFLVIVIVSMVSNILMGNIIVALVCVPFTLLIAIFLWFLRKKKEVIRNVARMELETSQTSHINTARHTTIDKVN